MLDKTVVAVEPPSKCIKWVLIFLLGVVLFQSLIIVKFITNSSLRGPETGELNTLQCRTETHHIQKRAASTGGGGGQYCPPGCVRRRIRTTTTARTLQNYEYGYTGYDYAQQGARGPSGARGAPGPQGERGRAGAPGLSGEYGESGLPGAQGARGSAGESGPPGSSGASGARGPPGGQGLPGLQGARGSSGARGPPGAVGARGSPGASGGGGGYFHPIYGTQQDSTRGDQYETTENSTAARRKQLVQVLNDLRLYDHPKCVTALDHEQVVNQLKEHGKASFMIMVDLAKSVYCIVHA